MKQDIRSLLLSTLVALTAAGCAEGAQGGIRAPAPRAGNATTLPGLEGPVTVTSDRLGIPTISATSRQDALRALGLITARDRMFQLDLLRRSNGGRLAEILGRGLLEADTRQREHGVPQAARAILARLPESQRAALDAYAEGVNAYLRSAEALPIEFQKLGYRPEPWRPEDSVLVVLGMFNALSESEDSERTQTVLTHSLPRGVMSFLLESVDPYTRALLGAQDTAPPPLPAEELRALVAQRRNQRPPSSPSQRVLGEDAGEAPIGSNGWAVAGQRTRDGRAILANDMHLELGVPNIWYRAELRYGEREVAGVVLPGVPVVIVGTNRHVAWGLTSLLGDVMDLVRLETVPERPGEYRTPSGWKRFDVAQETIKVRGEPDASVTVRRTIWGPVAARPLLGAPVAIRWTALDPEGVDLGILEMDRVRSVDEAVAVMSAAGGPGCNVLLADRDGRVAWTVTGRMPRRSGFDGSVSVSWADGRAGWDGYLAPAALPRIVDPPSGFVVNANHRMPLAQGAPVLARDHANGYRAYRITERLRETHPVAEADMFQLQLDTRAEFFGFYRDLALRVLTEEAVSRRPALAEARRAAAAWDGRADASSVGLPLLARFRRVLTDDVFAAWLGASRAAEPDLTLAPPDIDTPLQRALEARSADLVPAPAGGWDAFVLGALEKAMMAVKQENGGLPLDQIEWGAVSRVRIAHPLGASPELAALLNMPDEPLPGCSVCVRLSSRTVAASERLVVSPGHEQDGILHMPAGQSGDPLSPHYRDQQRAWVDGRPLPLLAGPAEHTITLVPERR
ncbi:Penicillin amidase [Sorangium cellulosum So ce56]|uniref:Penicillin amidase n=1 Tax=Sorangium cellulosum (strain So ce56) TaxID=448385 RepID=A9FNJ4_SORC5|nr:penicillin acylase family protein [Sorangium cellulosum]CAN98429.1 Penicillin amidase [Sorangium cellulosum So ce56]